MPLAKKNQLSAMEIVPLAHRQIRTLFEATETLQVLRHNARVCEYLFAITLRKIVDDELYGEGAFESAEAYRAATFPTLSPRKMWSLVAFARAVPPEVAAEYDPVQIDAGARLLRRTHKKDVPLTKEALEALVIPTVRDGRPVKVPFAEATPEEIYDASLKRYRKSLPPMPAHAESGRERLQKRLDFADVRHQHLGTEPVYVITFPVSQLARFEKALKA